jgi:hypothetical protein
VTLRRSAAPERLPQLDSIVPAPGIALEAQVFVVSPSSHKVCHLI